MKINSSIDFDTYNQYILDAQDKFIRPYLGQELIDQLSGETADTLKTYICRALGPFSLALATDEFSINIGEWAHRYPHHRQSTSL